MEIRTERCPTRANTSFQTIMEGEVIIQYKTNTNKNDNDLNRFTIRRTKWFLEKYGFSLECEHSVLGHLEIWTPDATDLELTDSEA